MKKQLGIQYNHEHNITKLIQQNVKLNKQIRILQTKMSNVITLDISRAVQADIKKNQTKVKYNQITMQESYIKKLKGKIKKLKALDLTSTTAGIINQENQLVAMKRQYQKLVNQRNILKKRCEQKKIALQYNNPLNDFKSETETQLAKIRKKNTEMSSKIVQLERQIRKYHKYQQMHKKYQDQKIIIQNPQYQISKLQHQRIGIVKKSKMIQSKWKPQIQALDKQYFNTKETLIRKQKNINQLEKQLKNWQTRTSAVRDQSDVLLDRERLSKVITASPMKNDSIQKEKSPPKNIEKKQQGGGFTDFLKNLFSSNKNQKDPDQVIKPIVNQSTNLKQQKPQLRKWNNLAAETRYATQSQKVHLNNQTKYDFAKLSEKNQFMNSKHSFEGFDLKNMGKKVQNQNLKQKQKKNKLVMNSVAVGTSFYYNQED